MIDLSVVTPVYKAEKIIPLLVSEIERNINNLKLDYEIILVNDGSPDMSWNEILLVCKNNPKVKGVNLSRNFGQHYAITAGLDISKGEWVVVMDCDMQDRPDQISKLYAKVLEGYDMVLARRVVRNDSPLKKFSSVLFYKVFGYLTDTEQDPTVANFGIYNMRVINAILSMKDHIRYFPTMSQWVGFKKEFVNVEHGEREEGESSYSWGTLIALATNNIIAFSLKPLRLTIKIGLFISIISALVGILYLLLFLFDLTTVSGFTSIMISVWFLAGIIIFILGIIGIYLGKVFEKVKDRPTYIISEKINF